MLYNVIICYLTCITIVIDLWAVNRNYRVGYQFNDWIKEEEVDRIEMQQPYRQEIATSKDKSIIFFAF